MVIDWELVHGMLVMVFFIPPFFAAMCSWWFKVLFGSCLEEDEEESLDEYHLSYSEKSSQNKEMDYFFGLWYGWVIIPILKLAFQGFHKIVHTVVKVIPTSNRFEF
jgi:hypothetical protein